MPPFPLVLSICKIQLESTQSTMCQTKLTGYKVTLVSRSFSKGNLNIAIYFVTSKTDVRSSFSHYRLNVLQNVQDFARKWWFHISCRCYKRDQDIQIPFGKKYQLLVCSSKFSKRKLIFQIDIEYLCSALLFSARNSSVFASISISSTFRVFLASDNACFSWESFNVSLWWLDSSPRTFFLSFSRD